MVNGCSSTQIWSYCNFQYVRTQLLGSISVWSGLGPVHLSKKAETSSIADCLFQILSGFQVIPAQEPKTIWVYSCNIAEDRMLILESKIILRPATSWNPPETADFLSKEPAKQRHLRLHTLKPNFCKKNCTAVHCMTCDFGQFSAPWNSTILEENSPWPQRSAKPPESLNLRFVGVSAELQMLKTR